MHRSLLIVALLLPLAGYAATSCPQAFPEFVAQFERSEAFQRAHTRFPLPYSYVDSNAEPERKTITVMVNRSTVSKFSGIKYPSLVIQRAVPLERKTSTVSGGTEVIRFDKPDTDMYTIEFHFKKSGACWQLVNVDNMSL
ncbi:MAG: hypothetical protein Q7U28_19770 [Aquabacterium sp.]|nr:hypothetical protein [Aquabacterium sp.]